MKKIFLFAVFMAIMISVFIRINKPTITVYMGSFTPSQVFGPTVAEAKRMNMTTYNFKVVMSDFPDFSPIAYKKKYPEDTVMGNGWTVTLLTNDLSHLSADSAIQEIHWLKYEVYESGKRTYLKDVSLVSIVIANLRLKIWLYKQFYEPTTSTKGGKVVPL